MTKRFLKINGVIYLVRDSHLYKYEDGKEHIGNHGKIVKLENGAEVVMFWEGEPKAVVIEAKNEIHVGTLS